MTTAHWTVYRLTCQVSGKSYVGITRKSPKARWYQHKVHALREKRGNALGAAIRKYGGDNFQIETIAEVASEEEAASLERHYISSYNTLTPHGYNLTTGGEVNKNLSVESRAKISAKARGRKLSPEVAAKRGLSRVGKKLAISEAEHLRRVEAGRQVGMLGRGQKRPITPARQRSLTRAAETRRISPELKAMRRKARQSRHYQNYMLVHGATKKTLDRRAGRTAEEMQQLRVAKIASFHRGRKRSTQTRAKLSAAASARQLQTCRQGHAYTVENSVINSRGHRNCRICLSAKRARARTAMRASTQCGPAD